MTDPQRESEANTNNLSEQPRPHSERCLAAKQLNPNNGCICDTPSVPDSAAIAQSIRNFMVTPIDGTPEEMLRFELDFITKQVEAFGRAQYAKAIEKAAEVCEHPKGLVSRDYVRYAQSTVAPEIRALLPPSEGIKITDFKHSEGCWCNKPPSEGSK